MTKEDGKKSKKLHCGTKYVKNNIAIAENSSWAGIYVCKIDSQNN